jgi:hypothetical protein
LEVISARAKLRGKNSLTPNNAILFGPIILYNSNMKPFENDAGSWKLRKWYSFS